MPSTIIPVELTRTHSVKPAQGLRYGNFEGVVHLPPVTTRQSYAEENFWQLNNQQIYKTICEWFQSWRPWQQDHLLCGITDRCSLRQLDILATTLEPLRHSGVFNVRRSSRALRENIVPKQTLLYTPVPRQLKSRTLNKQRTYIKYGNAYLQSSQEQRNLDKTRKSDSENPQKNLNLVSSDFDKAILGEDSSENNNKSLFHLSESNNKPGLLTHEKSLHFEKSLDKLTSEKGRDSSDEAVQNNQEKIPATVDEYSHSLALNIIKAAIQTVVVTNVYDKSQALRENSDILKTNEKPVKSESGNTTELESTSSSIQMMVTSPQNKNKNNQSSVPASAIYVSFLGGTVELKNGSSKNLISGHNSASSEFRHSAFSLSAVSTAGFFSPFKILRFGPPVHLKSVNHPKGLSSLPITLTKIYQHQKWWRGASVGGSYQHAFKKADKKELSSNFQDQLEHIWKWLSQWEDFERIALLKDIVKISSPNILESLVSHIHQRLREEFDINRLPDKLLLFILSFLPPHQINVASQVCRRWRFLTASDELWMLKCLEMGEMEGIENIPQLVLNAGKSDRLVDWKQAFYELRYLITSMKKRLSRPTDVDIDVYSNVENTPAPADMTGKLQQQGTQASLPLVKAKSKKLKSALDNVDMDSVNDVSMDEDLLPILDEYTLNQGMNEVESPDRYYYCQRRKISQKKTKSDGTQESFISEEPETESPLKELIRSKRQLQGGDDDETEDRAQDIRPKLEPSNDLLGKKVPSTALEWQTTESDTKVSVRASTFAGIVKSVRKVRKLQGHMSGIVCLNFDKKRLITGGMDRTVRVWDIRSGRSIHKFCGHKGGIRCLQFDDEILATGSWDMLIVLWDMKLFTKIVSLVGHTDCVSCLEINKYYVVSGSHDCTVRVWSRKTFYCCKVIKAHTGVINSLVLDGGCVLTSSSDMTLCMSNIETGNCVCMFDTVQKSILSLVITNDLVIGGDQTGNVYFWNKMTGESEAAIRAHDAPVFRVSYWNSRFWTAAGDHSIKEWDLLTLTCVRALQGHKGPVRDVGVSDDRVVSCSEDGTIRIWDFRPSKTPKKSEKEKEENL